METMLFCLLLKELKLLSIFQCLRSSEDFCLSVITALMTIMVVEVTVKDIGICICPHRWLHWIICCWLTQLPSQMFYKIWTHLQDKEIKAQREQYLSRA